MTVDRTSGIPDVREKQLSQELEGKLRTALEAEGHRYTAQRAAVYEALHGTCSHPTADEIFSSVRAHNPDISLATVYKALEAFVSCGMACKLTVGPGPARYDSWTDQHDHVRCLTCGRVSDVENGRRVEWLDRLSGGTDFELVGYRLELVGYCPRCRH